MRFSIKTSKYIEKHIALTENFKTKQYLSCQWSSLYHLFIWWTNHVRALKFSIGASNLSIVIILNKFGFYLPDWHKALSGTGSFPVQMEWSTETLLQGERNSSLGLYRWSYTFSLTFANLFHNKIDNNFFLTVVTPDQRIINIIEVNYRYIFCNLDRLCIEFCVL